MINIPSFNKTKLGISIITNILHYYIIIVHGLFYIPGITGVHF